MYDFIILGFVPGTHIQITFELWLQCAGSLTMLLIIFKMHRAHLFRNALIALTFIAATSGKFKF